MGELIEFPGPRVHRHEGDIGKTPFGRSIYNRLGRPVFQAAIDKAREDLGEDAKVIDIDLGSGDVVVVPLRRNDPDKVS